MFSLPGSTHRLPMIHQTEVAECGLASLAMVARFHGHDIDLPSLRRRFSLSIKGSSLSRLIANAEALGFDTRPIRLELDALGELQTPCILHWDLNHFVVLKQVGSRRVTIHDPARGERSMDLDELGKHFTGVVLEITPRSDFVPVRERRHVSLRALAGQIRGLASALGLVAVLAVSLEVFTLLLPLLLQLVIDQVLVTADIDLLHLLGIGFLAVVVFQSMTVAVRGWVVSALSASMNSQWVTNLFGHMLRLPMDYFGKRHIGDIMSRYSSLNSIQQTITGGFIETLLNGSTAALVLIVLLLYSPMLTGLVVAAFTAYLLARWAAYAKVHRLNEEQLIHSANQQSRVIESIRGIQAIKLANKQGERRGQIANATVEVANRQARIERVTAAFRALDNLIFGGLRVVLIWVGAGLVLSGQWTVGMMVVFLAYAQMFSSRSAALIDYLVEFRLLGLHAERLADIAMEAPEEDGTSPYSGSSDDSTLEVVDLSFRYSDEEPWILKDCSLRISAGESVAIVGPSGCGKSTLAKLLLGLLEPSKGAVCLGGVDARQFGLSSYREHFAAVMQDDQLFAGSIADNIAFFDGFGDLKKIEQAAYSAAIHDDIVAMPMGYETLVGDMGSALSGGQKQRVLLARAFYRNPEILILDEATSHLDLEKERWINEAIRGLGVTRIHIAHRPQTIASADRIIAIEGGRARVINAGDSPQEASGKRTTSG